jgi:recombination protein RecT
MSSNLTARSSARSDEDKIKENNIVIHKMFEKLKPQLALAVPDVMNSDRVARVALTELRKNHKLAEAVVSSPETFMAAMLTAAALGLEVGNGLGQAYLVPNFNRKTGKTEIRLDTSYRGMLDLARRSGEIESVSAIPVYAGEKFKVTLGLEPNIEHERCFDDSVSMNDSDIIAVYVVVKLKGGGFQFEVMTRQQIEKIRLSSPAGSSGPWSNYWAEMAKKTVFKRIFKWLPVSIEVKSKHETRRVSLSSAIESGVTINESGDIIGGEFEQVGENESVNVSTGEVINKEPESE